MSNLVFLVGGGILQLPIAYEIKQRGYDLLVTDNNFEASCKGLVDIFIQLSTYDVVGHLALVDDFIESPVVVLTDAADVGPTVSALTEFLGLSGMPYHIR